MRAAWLTDVHLNFLENQGISRFLETILQADPDIVLLGGDIGEADSLIPNMERIERTLNRPVYFVLGNHDFYGGSIASVRAQVESLAHDSKYLTWLNMEGLVPLTRQTALIGHDSWADGRLGDYPGSSVELNDFYLIDEFVNLGESERLNVMQTLGDEAAAHLGTVLAQTLRDYTEIVALTHVPPFHEATWHEGEISGDDYLPFFSCDAVGKVLLAMMQDNPSSRLTVLCGHTHGEGICEILPNLCVRTGGAKYGSPAIQTILNLP